MAQVAPITPTEDAKLQTLLGILPEKVLAQGKRLIFTQYADTARYLFENLNAHGKHQDIDVIFSGDKSKFRVVGRFSPHSNPEYTWQAGDTELNTVIATDVLSEGLNLQDCDTIINYDLHWNPVRLIQRFGRIDRIGSDHDTVYGLNFLPETGMDKYLGLRQKLQNRISEIHTSIGEDSAILDPSEQINEEAQATEEKDEPLVRGQEMVCQMQGAPWLYAHICCIRTHLIPAHSHCVQLCTNSKRLVLCCASVLIFLDWFGGLTD